MRCRHDWVLLDELPEYIEHCCSKCKALKVKETAKGSDKKTRYYKHWMDHYSYRVVGG